MLDLRYIKFKSSNDKKYLYNLACYAKEALTLRNNSECITIH